MGEQRSLQSAERKGRFEMLTYVWEYQNYADALRKDSQNLKARLFDVQKKVEEARSNHHDIKQQVLKWLDDGDKELEITENFLASFRPLACCWKFTCESNCKRRYALAKRAESHSKDIKKLMETCCFEGGVSLELKPPPSIPTPLTTTTPSGYISVPSREKYLMRTMEALLDKDKFVIGLYGAKDVGKTMLVNKLAVAIESGGMFNGVSITSGDQADELENYAQVEMGQRVGLTLNLDSADKARLLNDKLRSMRKVVIIIDNLEKRLDLNKIGIPWPDNNNDCRIVVVSRSLDVCKEMKTQINLEIEHMCQEEALYLFDEIAKESNFTNTRSTQEARDKILSKFLWTPGEIKGLMLVIRNSHKMQLSPVKSIVAIDGSAKKTLILGAEALVIVYASKPQHWRWLAPSPSTSSLKVAELIIDWYLSIAAKVREEWLSPATNYGAYFVYQLTPRARGFSNTPMEITVGNTIKTCYLDPSTAASKPLEAMPKRRKDGWLEVELGNFFNVGHSGDVVDLLVKETRAFKSGLLVQGFELRSLD